MSPRSPIPKINNPNRINNRNDMENSSINSPLAGMDVGSESNTSSAVKASHIDMNNLEENVKSWDDYLDN
jgi:hypothetical protein